MKRTFRMSARIKGTEKVFAEGFDPGVIATQDVEYDAEPEEYERPFFTLDLMRKQEEFLNEQVEVVLEEVPVD